MKRADKIETYSFMMALGELTSRCPEFVDVCGFVDMCIALNISRNELIKQHKNIISLEGSVNGKFHSGSPEPFAHKILKVRENMSNRVKKQYPWMRLAFESDGGVYLILNGEEIDISMF